MPIILKEIIETQIRVLDEEITQNANHIISKEREDNRR
jgi:hypothetical protein